MILFISPFNPASAAWGGGSWVDRRLLQSLLAAAGNTQVEAVALSGSADDSHVDGVPVTTVGPIVLEIRRNRARLAQVGVRMALSPEPYQTLKFRTDDAWSRAVAELQDVARRADVVVTSGWPSLLACRDAGITPDVHVAHNVEHLIAEWHAPRPLRWLGEPARLRRAEMGALSLPRTVLALSRSDVERLHAFGIPARHLPMPVVLPAGRDVTPQTVGYIGAAGWPPNARELQVLVREVMPRVNELRGSVTELLLAGRGTEQYAAEVGVTRSGWCRDPGEFFGAVGVLALPRGEQSTGISIKVLDATEAGVQSVVHPAVADALTARPPWLTAAGADEMARVLVAALDDPHLRRAPELDSPSLDEVGRMLADLEEVGT